MESGFIKIYLPQANWVLINRSFHEDFGLCGRDQRNNQVLQAFDYSGKTRRNDIVLLIAETKGE